MRYFILDFKGELAAWELDTSLSLGEVKKLLGSPNIKEVEEDEYLEFVESQGVPGEEEVEESPSCCELLEKRIAILEGEVKKLSNRNDDLEKKMSEITGIKTLDDEILYLRSSGLDSKGIASRYNKTNKNRNNFSTTEIFKKLGGTGNPSERLMAEFIYEKIK